MNRRISAFAVSTFALVVAAPAFAAAPPVATPADLGTAVSAQVACASIFVAGRAEADVLRDDIHAFAPFTRRSRWRSIARRGPSRHRRPAPRRAPRYIARSQVAPC
jgi:hypothetical protein